MTGRLAGLLVLGAAGMAMTALAGGGVDEFGRHHLTALAGAIALSVSRAAVMAILLLLLSFFLVVIVELRPGKLLAGLVQVLVDGLESVPIYIWVLAAISWAPRQGAPIAIMVFVIAGLPLMFNSLRGVVQQIVRQPYYQAAIALGASEWQLVRNHIAPNAIPHLTPLIMHVLGAAIAVYGGIGVFGFVNRQELDLGVFLLRGKEQAAHSLIVLASTILAFLLIFLALHAIMKVQGSNERRISGRLFRSSRRSRS